MPSVELPLEEKLMEEAGNKNNATIHSLQTPRGFRKELAWELANLVRIAYADYERYDHKKDLENLIQEKDNLWLPLEATRGLVKHFWLSHGKDEPISGGDDSPPPGAIRYEVMATFTYLAFNLDVPPRPEVDRFGFILQRDLGDGQKDLYILFRGTMEPAEWFNDFQYKQIPFLMPDETFAGQGEICLGFNKIYTDYRPGILIDKETANKYSRWIDEKVRETAMAANIELCQQHKLSIKDTVHQKLGALIRSGDVPNSIHVAGHSLGAALATICALHVTLLCEKEGASCPVELYTFASPRVGDSVFARNCNQRLTAFRIANSEDVIPGIPPATLRVVGEEMTPGHHVNALRAALARITGGVSDDVFEHVGAPVTFTLQLGEISSNHNMGFTYCCPLMADSTSP